MSTQTADGQRKVVFEILAAGWISLGAGPVPADRLRATSAFRSAWSTWSAAHQFPLIRADDFYIGVSMSRRRTGVIAALTWGKTLHPLKMDGYEDWDDAEFADFIAETSDRTGITEASVLALARSFLGGMQSDRDAERDRNRR